MLLKGKGVSGGVALGRVYVYRPFSIEVNPAFFKGKDEKYIELYEDAKKKSEKELEALVLRVKEVDETKVEIFSAHLAILLDEDIDHQIKNEITVNKKLPSYAVESVFNNYIDTLEKLQNSSFRERISDIKDVKFRFLRNLFGGKEQSISYLSEPVVIVCHDLLPSDTVTMDRLNVLGIVTEIGSSTSHSAIIAKSFCIPAVLGVPNLMEKVKNHQEIILDADEGDVILKPTEQQMIEYSEKHTRFMLLKEAHRKYLKCGTFTKDKEKIDLGLNIGNGSLYECEKFQYVDFIGLLRSEFLYMNNDSLPTEEEQLEEYKKVLVSAEGKSVTIRTLDIGGDKTLDYLSLPIETNPFLGIRAIRFCFENEEIFRTQLRALYRASVFGNLKILLPMIESLDEIRKVKRIINEIKEELDSEDYHYDNNVELGIMIEVPSIAIMADKVVKEVDFASIGTNDLCQYLLACDRGNPKMVNYYQNFHPSLFRLIDFVSEVFNKEGKSLSVCGELAGDILASLVMVGSGIKKLSMSIISVVEIRINLEKYTMKELKEIRDHVIDLSTEEEVKEYLSRCQKEKDKVSIE
ncbi:MAG: phosphoenolpyruvate--protein phosphotransferase [Sphaerochaetaceae bacterium]|nr:phosphoenolpyruvate--protein phosphotransferase [Sphaerochaetaceae bacterium]